MMSQCKFSCNKCTTLLEDIDNAGGYVFVGAGFIQKISIPSCQFCCEPKTALKMPMKTIMK